jgi:hypothetical protein
MSPSVSKNIYLMRKVCGVLVSFFFKILFRKYFFKINSYLLLRDPTQMLSSRLRIETRPVSGTSCFLVF